jgi:hypothetical protein
MKLVYRSAYVHAYIHTYKHACIYTARRSYAEAGSFAYIHACILISMHTFIYTQTHIHTVFFDVDYPLHKMPRDKWAVCMHAMCTQAYVCVYLDTRIYIYIYIYIYICMYTYMS